MHRTVDYYLFPVQAFSRLILILRALHVNTERTKVTNHFSPYLAGVLLPTLLSPSGNPQARQDHHYRAPSYLAIAV